MDPFSQKLTTVLSASYADADIRDTLQALDGQFTYNTPESRRRLRINAQMDVIRTNVAVVREFSKIAEQLKHVGATIAAINNVCQDMRQHLSAAATDTLPILDEANTLMSQNRQVKTKEQLLDAFSEHFIVSDEDIITITSSGEPIDDRFFAVLARVKVIHEDCQVLLATENQRAGLEIMEQMTKHLHAAFQKLFRWIQREFKNLSLENHQVNAGIRRALRVLAERPTLFQSCLDFFSEARQKIILQSFFDALTGSEQEITMGTAKPIEFYAHDSLRYIGDMLAWLHSATVGEQEALEVLFISGDDSSIAKRLESGLASEPWGGGYDARQSLLHLVEKNLESVSRPLKSRIEQVIASHDDSTLAYRISNLINFYRLTFEKLLGKNSSVVDMMKSMEQFALRQFQHNLRDHVRQVQADLPQAPSDLAPPEFLQDAMKELRLLMLSYDSSLAPQAQKEAEFLPILTDALDPYLSGCQSLAKDLKPLDCHIFLINCLLAAKSILEQFPFTTGRVALIETTLASHRSELVHIIHNYILDNSAMRPLLEAINDWDPNVTPLSHMLPFSPHSLSQVSQTLDRWLPSAQMDAQSQLQKLSSPKTVTAIIHQAADLFLHDFTRVEQAIIGKDGLEFSRTVWPRTTEEVQLLLG